MKFLTLCLSIVISIPCLSQSNKIRGVVTYFFNEYQGDKPDVGARIYIVDSAKCKKYSKEIAFQYELASISKKAGDPAFDATDSTSAINNNEIMLSPNVMTTTVDASGSYSIDVSPGTYYVLMQSKGRNRDTRSETLGKIYYSIVRIKKGQTIDCSNNFRLNY